MYTPILYYHTLDAMEKASTISADLHYLASVGKKPAETQDASTNTNPGKCYTGNLQKPTISGVASWLVVIFGRVSKCSKFVKWKTVFCALISYFKKN